MKVRVSYVTDVSDDYRRAITCSWGEHGRKATRAEVQGYLERGGAANDDDLLYDFDQCDICHPRDDDAS
jgi:hypothetical protein